MSKRTRKKANSSINVESNGQSIPMVNPPQDWEKNKHKFTDSQARFIEEAISDAKASR
jgi:hypothetical protein